MTLRGLSFVLSQAHFVPHKKGRLVGGEISVWDPVTAHCQAVLYKQGARGLEDGPCHSLTLRITKVKQGCRGHSCRDPEQAEALCSTQDFLHREAAYGILNWLLERSNKQRDANALLGGKHPCQV